MKIKFQSVYKWIPIRKRTHNNARSDSVDLKLFSCFEKAIHYHHLKFKIVIQGRKKKAERLIYSFLRERHMWPAREYAFRMKWLSWAYLLFLPCLLFRFFLSLMCRRYFPLICVWSLFICILFFLDFFPSCCCCCCCCRIDDVVATFICSSKRFIWFWCIRICRVVSHRTKQLQLSADAINRSSRTWKVIAANFHLLCAKCFLFFSFQFLLIEKIETNNFN